MEKWIFKILRPSEWQAAQNNPAYGGAPVDLADGYIHFSTLEQLAGTAEKYFNDAPKVHILAFDSSLWPKSDLLWEPSRGGALFPHVYGPLNISLASKNWILTQTNGSGLSLNEIHHWIAQ
jgi:uncharacterized protein (DUF952 family)